LGKENVFAVLMPYGKFSSLATAQGKVVCTSVGLAKNHILQRDIQKVVNKIEKQEKISDYPRECLLRGSGEAQNDKVRKGNIMARIRMTFLYEIAKENNALVIGTEN